MRVQGGTTSETAGGSQVSFKVSIEGPTATPITVNYATGDNANPNHAVVNADYTPKTGSLSFTPGGAFEQTVTVNALDDATFEADAETFNFTATVAANGQAATALGTIVDNEPHPTVVAISDLTLNEGASGKTPAQLTVTLDKASAAPVTVRYTTIAGTAQAGTDYVAKVNKSLVIEAGKTSKPVSLQVFGDTAIEPNETFTVHAARPVRRRARQGLGHGDDHERRHRAVDRRRRSRSRTSA